MVYSGTLPLGHLIKGDTLVMGTLLRRPIYIISIYFNLSNRGTLLMGTKSSSPGGVPIREVRLYLLKEIKKDISFNLRAVPNIVLGRGGRGRIF